jgi:hypothetical protein
MRLSVLVLAAALTGCSGAAWKSIGGAIATVIKEAAREGPLGPLPRTRAERTNYTETSSHADVVAFLDALQRAGLPAWVGSIGKTTEGRDIPFVIASRPLVTTPAQARRLGRPIVYVQGNIHAGEVEGKEALQMLLRDLLSSSGTGVLDSIVLVAVPIYNADGNERLAPQARNRGAQNGPEMVGERANAQRFDLNRDYVKAEAPETRGSLAMFDMWDPDVFVDLHTTNGSYHGYALTYSGSLNPAAFSEAYSRDSLLPELRRRVKARHGYETFDYGNFRYELGVREAGEGPPPSDTARQAWYTYDHRPRFGTNYYGLRGRVSILSEAYSHDPFERRVKSTYAFVRELLSLVAERGPQIIARSAEADARATVREPYGTSLNDVPIRSEVARAPSEADVIAEELERTGDSTLTQPGVPRGVRRTGRYKTVRMPVYDRFRPTKRESVPRAYAIPSAESDVVRRLRAHGIIVERLTAEWSANVEPFVVDSAIASARPFQGHNEVRVIGHRRGIDRRTLASGTFIVRTAQPLGVLAMYLLEPESDDGLVTWNAFDRALQRGAEFPVLRVRDEVTGARRLEP